MAEPSVELECQFCGYDHPGYSPCVEPPAWKDCHNIDGSIDEATAFPPAPEGYEPILDDEGRDTGYRRELATGNVFTLDDGDGDDC